MLPFLAHTAQHLWKTYGEELSPMRVVFPNKRSTLYFTNYLKKEAKGIFIPPQCITINELFWQESNKIIADKLTLTSKLYQSYQKITKTKENFSDFYPFANLLLGDFDTIDKHLVDTEQLFKNIRNLQAIDSTLSYLTEEQIAAIQQFWKSFEVVQHSQQQQLFLEMWQALPKVYTDFNEHLEQEGIAYEGRVFREVASNLQNGGTHLADTTHIFVGFNVLSKAERDIFRLLHKQDKALFYWDYDSYFTENKYHEAGRFIQKHISDFPNAPTFLQEEKMTERKDVTHIQCATEVQQAKVLGEMLLQFSEEELAKTAIVLANEALLPTVLASLPEELQGVNISMGYPLKETASMQFLELLAQLHKTTVWKEEKAYFSTPIIQKILQHSFAEFLEKEEIERLLQVVKKGNKTLIAASEFTDKSTLIFSPIKQQSECYPYLQKLLAMLFPRTKNKAERELMKQTSILAQRLHDTLSSVTISNNQFFWLLLLQELGQQRMPFKTQENAKLQLIGFLETRLLDFENVFVLSANENYLPNIKLAGSLVPYNLRIGAGLPTLDEQNSMYAYYFYRLLSRAEKITLFSVTGSEDMQCKEQSRYITQLKYEAPFAVKEVVASANLQWLSPNIQMIAKDTEEVQQTFEHYFSGKRKLSPSAINGYLRCPQHFYYRYIKSIKEVEQIAKADDSNMFGSIFHKATELLYSEHIGEVLSPELFKKIGQKENIERVILEAFRVELFAEENRALQGKELLIFDTLKLFMEKLIKRDTVYAPFRIIGLEQKIEGKLPISVNDEAKEITLYGSIDRIDEKDGQIRVVDYKTGKVDRGFLDLENLFVACGEKRNPTALQTFLYSWLYYQNESVLPMPCVYQLKEIEKEVSAEFVYGESRNKKPFSFAEHWQEYEELLQNCLGELFGNKPHFFPTENATECTHDSHSGICVSFGG